MTLRERYERLYAGVVYDALTFDLHVREPFVVHRDIRPAWPVGARVVAGPAFTCRGERVREAGHVRDLVRIEMFHHFTTGCVQVIDTGGDESVAHFGDNSGRLARRHGAVCALIDGTTRDVRLLERDAFPVFCRGVQPIDAFGRWQIVAHGEPVHLAGADGRVRVQPGDWVFMDADGALIVPAALAGEACDLAERRVAREDDVRRRVGEVDAESLYHDIGRW